ncbi:phosphotransferase [Streptomyces sp. NPDC054796]
MLADRPDGTVVRLGDVVAKAHASDSDPGALAVRLQAAAHPRLASVLLAPLPATPPTPLAPPAPHRSATPLSSPLPDGRAASLWPYGSPVDPEDPSAAPWEEAGTLLARLHAVPPLALSAGLTGPLPLMRGPVKAARALARMRATVPPGHPAARAVERAWAGLPAWCRAQEPEGASRIAAPRHAAPSDGSAAADAPLALCHGDFHLGQLVRHPAPDGPWKLIDVDDLGLGDPAWDLARPAAWYAAGVLPPAEWYRFLGAYQSTNGTAGRDPWPRLDAPARALTAQIAALALTKAYAARRPLDGDEEACVDACARIAAVAELP